MTATRARMRLGVTEAGRMLLMGTVFFGLAAQLVPAFGVLSALIVVLLTVLIVGFVLRPRIEVTAHLPDHVVAGQNALFRYTLTNVARVPAYDLHVRFVGLPETIEQVAGAETVARLGPGESIEVAVTMRARRRGHHLIPLPMCQSSFPFNLLVFGSYRKDKGTLTVYPVFYRLPMRLSRLSGQGRSGVAGFAGRAEVSPEYAGNRPFLPGDSPRRIDTRAWARLSVPATKEYHNDADRCAALVLDTRIRPDRKRASGEEVPELEAAVSLCASVAFTIQQDCLVEWLLAGPELHDFTPSAGRPALGPWAGRGRQGARVDAIHEILATVEPAEDYDLDQTAAALTSRFHRISEVVFILLRPDRVYQELLGLAAASRCHCRVYQIAGADTQSPGSDELPSDSVTLLSPEDVLAGRLGPL
ncbi:MAG TPA: DUF58 domain-containing protein [Sedimentisphaerales bacterium]|nr:DUF58 domain-containing protein [Sedimentisphaerales bacterium]HRS12790.1 DUF58 domain-containing protein [Sedimentisphaerales bacterium]HRV49423.1 DUF58 domain-containing protein [Sedimentisphaerales bacterium]